MTEKIRTRTVLEGEYDDDQVLNPVFKLIKASNDGREYRELYLQTFSQRPGSPTKWGSHPPEAWHLLATIYVDRIIMYPVHAYPHAQRYLHPRHGSIHTLVYEHNDNQALPGTADDAVAYIELWLPHRLFNPCSHGLGLIKELDPLWKELSTIRNLDTLIVAASGFASLTDHMVRVTETELDEFRRKFERVKRIARDKVKLARSWMVRNDLLPKLDASRFPRIEAVTPGASLVELRRESVRSSTAVTRTERRSSVQTVLNNLPQLATEEPHELLQLHAEIERVTLERMIERFEGMLRQNLTESRWQRFFEENVFILSLLFTRPVRLLHTQFHAQGSGLAGSGAQIGDFLLAEQGQALAIVEIKKPGTEMTSGPYRNTEVFGPSTELAGAVTQVLHQQSVMRINWLGHRERDANLSNSRSDAIRCIVIAGTYPTDPKRQRSFEIFRNACKDVDVITFDELLGKLQMLHQHLTPPPAAQEPNAPF